MGRLVRIEQGKCRLISRKGNEFRSFRSLNESLLAELKVKSAVLDGEIVYLNDAGTCEFRDLLFRRGEERFVAFDLIWCDGQDLCYAPLTERKHKLRTILPWIATVSCTAITSRLPERACSSLPAITT